MVIFFDFVLLFFVGDFDFEGDSKDGGGEYENVVVGIVNIDFVVLYF